MFHLFQISIRAYEKSDAFWCHVLQQQIFGSHNKTSNNMGSPKRNLKTKRYFTEMGLQRSTVRRIKLWVRLNILAIVP